MQWQNCVRNRCSGAQKALCLVIASGGPITHVAGPGTTDIKNVMPGAAALLEAQFISEITGIVDADTIECPVYAGNAIQAVKVVAP
ncbi:hypothetical protein [Yoonia sp. BS5-3]|uniref:Electron transfer flavoprotein alpha/beta-subunit N-terminal domain-containing protein n=1 Tax=Yoonia phaeophyticola TaxID=3137369 RepID=A0ABZ2V1S0_9RHOB